MLLNSGLDLSVTKLVDYLLMELPWHKNCEIFKDEKGKIIVQYNDGSRLPSQLRYSTGPRQGFFWDVYGEDFQNVELAIIALSKAPAPRNGCITIPTTGNL